MKTIGLLWMLLLWAPAFGQMKARDYYQELYAAGGLDRMASEYACFQDDPMAVNFFIFSESKLLRSHMQENGTFSKLSKPQQQELKKDFLNVRGYQQGVPWANESFLDKDGESWVTDKFILPTTKVPAVVRFTLNWQTLRYKWSVEYGSGKESANFGRCELVTGGVRQTQ
jgi:hypothetical protein